MSNAEVIEEKYEEAVSGMKEEWFNAIDTKWYDYVVGLPIRLQIVYLVVVLHNQIFNGGFHQYFVNGYGQFAKETINSLKIIGALKKAELLKEALETVNKENSSDEVFRRQLLNKEIAQLFSNDKLFEPLDKMDSAYYADEGEDVEKLLVYYLGRR